MRDALGLLAAVLHGFFGLCWIVCLVAALFYATPPQWAMWGFFASLPFWLLNRWLPGDWRP